MDTNSRSTPEMNIDHWVDYNWLLKRKGRSAEIFGKSERVREISSDGQGALRVGPDYIKVNDVLAIYPRGRKGRPLYCEVVEL